MPIFKNVENVNATMKEIIAENIAELINVSNPQMQQVH